MKIRYYIHGDKKGSSFYCKRCDSFEAAQHSHFDPTGNGLDVFKASKKGFRVLKSNFPEYFRPTNAANIFTLREDRTIDG